MRMMKKFQLKIEYLVEHEGMNWNSMSEPQRKKALDNLNKEREEYDKKRKMEDYWRKKRNINRV